MSCWGYRLEVVRRAVRVELGRSHLRSHCEVIIVGSQAILVSYSEDDLPIEATMSIEVDVVDTAVIEGRLLQMEDRYNEASAVALGWLASIRR